jgi:four helix bundle protein
MSDFYNFENLECWKQAKDLAVDMFRFTGSGNMNSDSGLSDQLKNSAIGVMSNIAEGKTLGNANDFIHYLKYAKASAAALRSNLVITRDLGYLDEGDFLDLTDRANRVSALIGGLINAIKRNISSEASEKGETS